MATVRPTPTQAENDQAAIDGHGPLTHEPDGSPEEPSLMEKQAEAKPGTAAGYKTRQTTTKVDK
jgi:hypothetical protein